MRAFFSLLFVFGLIACSTGSQNDPIFLALKANPPTKVSEKDLKKLRAQRVACNLFNEGTVNEYQTCWFPSGRPTRTIQLFYYKPAVRGGIYPGSNLITYLKI